ncbi:Phospholipase A2 crotoxin acid subunit CA [Sparganum proliferum]
MACSSSAVVDYGYGPTNGEFPCEEKLKLPKLSVKRLQFGPQVLKKGKHNFSISFPEEKIACIEGGPLREGYILQQFHFHWGHENKWGSEHQVDGCSHSAEMHLVFLAERYSAQSEALEDPEGLCVLGIFLRASGRENDAFKPLVKAVEKSSIGDENVLDTPIDVFAILPDLSRYYTYEGSLTTPPCSECVRWIVCADPVEVSDTQLQWMRTMHKCDCCETCENFRPPLPLGHRPLIRSFKQ